MEKYFVVAIKWDEKRKMQIKYIAGEFTTYLNARIFCDAYTEYWSSTAEIIKEFDWLNK